MEVLTDKPEDVYQEYKAAVDAVKYANGEFNFQLERLNMNGIMAAVQVRAKAMRDYKEAELAARGYYKTNRDLLYEEAIVEFYISNGLEPPEEEWHAENLRTLD